MATDTTVESMELTARPSAATTDLQASMSAVASARITGDLSATASAIGVATVDGATSLSLSAVGAVAASGEAAVSQSYATMVTSSGDMEVTQSIVPAAIARTVTFDQGIAGVVAGGEVEVRRGFIGILLAPEARLSEDTRVLLSGRALGIVAVAVLGGFGLVGLGVWLAARRLSGWMR